MQPEDRFGAGYGPPDGGDMSPMTAARRRATSMRDAASAYAAAPSARSSKAYAPNTLAPAAYSTSRSRATTTLATSTTASAASRPAATEPFPAPPAAPTAAPSTTLVEGETAARVQQIFASPTPRTEAGAPSGAPSETAVASFSGSMGQESLFTPPFQFLQLQMYPGTYPTEGGVDGGICADRMRCLCPCCVCLRLGFADVTPLPLKDDDAARRAIANLDRIPPVDLHKIGVVFVDEGQNTDMAIFSNTHGSPRYSRFVHSLGKLVRLKGGRWCPKPRTPTGLGQCG